MKGLKRISALLALTFIFAVPTATFTADAAQTSTGYTKAEDVVYKKTGKTVHNWGAREEECQFLSTYAQDFYVGNYTYETLSQKKGGTKQSDAHKSELYTALQDMMEIEHTFFTYYDGSKNVRDYYKYADCVQNDTTKVSLIYRGTLTSSAWNQGEIWNQEHMWPQSKLSSAEQKGDIMHLRPSNPSENSQRGNTPYGEGSDYYDPNEEGQSIRGDCARTMLYMYVRWGLYSKMWGKDGVMESADILLKWMREDPVDTWEMGRNDAVQSVTGTRNVFVDYPEYAWLLFGKTIPSEMSTPSRGNTEDGGQECAHSFSEWTITREPTETMNGVKMRSCIKCGAVERQTLPMLNGGNDSSDVGGEETGCQHEFDDWTITREPTETMDGVKMRSCNKCGSVERQSIPKLGGSNDGSLEDPKLEVGCESSIGVSVVALTMAIGVGLMLKKKENE